MKKLKRIICCFLLAILSVSFAGCSQEKEHRFTVRCDYGNVSAEGKVTLLLDGCSFFFDPSEYGIEKLIAGDVIALKYKGEMVVAESYPGQVFGIDKIISIQHYPANVHDFMFMGEADLSQSYIDYPEYVITDEDGSFIPLSEVESGTMLYCTFDPIPQNDGNGAVDYNVSAPSIVVIYAYDPKQ